MKKWLVAVLFGLALVLGACGGGDKGDDSADTGSDDNGGEAVETAAGEQVYQANCAMCHGSDLSGGAGPALDDAGSKFSAEELEDIIVNGTGSMPAQNVSGDDLNELVTWLSEQK